MDFRAKSKPVETVREHTDFVLAALETLFDLYGKHFTEKEKRLLRIACEYHDYGKIEEIFQEVLCGHRRSIEMPHGFLSGLFLFEDAKDQQLLSDFTDSEIKALYTAIHYHHTRPDSKTEAEYISYVQQHLKRNYCLFTGHEYGESSFRYLRRRLFINAPACSLRPIDEAFNVYLLLKGILNKADYAASAHLPIEIAPTSDLCGTVCCRFKCSFRPAQVFMKDHVDDNVVVVAPTGSGKTEAALLWLNGQKGFYTLPMKVSANAIFERIHGNKPCQYHFEESGLLHSDSLLYYLQSDTEEVHDRLPLMYRMTRQLSMPLTVTTVDQLFRFVFKALGTELYAATLKYSKVIIDEMQMYSPQILAMLVAGLQTITQLGGQFAIVTATLPKFIVRYLQEYMDVPCVCNQFVDELPRHWIHIQDQNLYNATNKAFDLDAIVKAGTSKKVLVLCNTVVQAQELARQIPQSHLLHARFIKKDRLRLEGDILDFANEPGACGIWISTMLVEASLDIDFDELHTEMCTADSLLQRLGRCFRRRVWSLQSPNIFVYDHGPCHIYDKEIYARSLDFLKKYSDRIFTEVEKLDFIDNVYDETAIKQTQYYQGFQKTLDDLSNISPGLYNKAEATELFRQIDTIAVIPDNVYNTNRDLIDDLLDQLKHGESRERYEALNQLDLLSVSVRNHSGDSQWADKMCLPETQIHRTSASYDFDPASGMGLGLLRQESTDTNFLDD